MKVFILCALFSLDLCIISIGDMVKTRNQADAPSPQGAWLVFSQKLS